MAGGRWFPYYASMRPGQAAPDEGESVSQVVLTVRGFNEAGASSPG